MGSDWDRDLVAAGLMGRTRLYLHQNQYATMLLRMVLA